MLRIQSPRVIFAAIFILIIGFLLLFGISFGRFAFTPAHVGADSSIIIDIRKGESPSEVAKDLFTKGAITDPRSFIWLGRLTRNWTKVKAGEYEVQAASTPLEILRVITSGISVAHPLTIREGENMYEVGADLESKNLTTQKRFIELCKDPAFIQSLGFQQSIPPTLEGYLFPDSYFFNRAMSPEEIVKQMIKRFNAAWKADYDRMANQHGMSRHEVVTLASMVEKETGAKQERPLISSVFHNRLRKRMRLQSDPTTIYGIWERYKGNIHRSDLLSQTPYNTYVIPALPIGPIGNPGIEAIEAALNPVQSDYLFFVSHNDGTHEFTRSLDDHNRAVRKFQLDPKAREGKSWRDLSKQQ